MADYQMKPVLQKPPGYRDPNMSSPPPPPPISQQPMRKAVPMPTSYRPKKKRRSCCRFCCCCICITLVLFIFLLLVGTAVFYLWFDPKLPTFSLASFRLDGFKLADDPDGASLSATAVARVEMKNPNSKLVFYYGNTAVEMSVGTGNDETGMGETTVNGFRQGPKNSTSVKVETTVKNELVERGLAKRLAAKFQSKDLVINVVAKTKVGLGVGGIKIGMLAVNLRCGGVSLNKLDTDSPQCTLNTLKWLNIQ
ncbi:Late embryogenesis abundant protein LEA_2 subgroup [Arabidopsis thaliana x Arabidopsis arenosa]|uniref:Late embryogenesis abundant protein LEA_2 subgroup n=1 Tax=Arabidopsis thaliana x Arabidopsis arenosa TaxID=1240361 RepID=A0A8T2ACM6_9BRAS|nr:Late embryogenesis abundant protein LEA_2 subgroup [Arabidopsis thaliana x Arabidopsis arenosa]KAG7570676.1 Late embryogenesis abundant protein LEA_2 subgroup [Arabidopsis thaliana x Arabidopsis arenosa]